MEKIFKWSGVVALVILAIIGFKGMMSSEAYGVAANCAGDVTCFTKLASLTSFQNDGTSIFNGAITNESTLAVTATSTLSDTVNFNNPGICINFYATSTATRMHMTASSTSLVNGVSTGVMLIDYGACAL